MFCGFPCLVYIDFRTHKYESNITLVFPVSLIGTQHIVFGVYVKGSEVKIIEKT